MGLIGLKELVDETKENEKKKKSNSRNLKSQTLRLSPLPTALLPNTLGSLHVGTLTTRSLLRPLAASHRSHSLAGPVRKCRRQRDQKIPAEKEGRGEEMGEVPPQPKSFYSSPVAQSTSYLGVSQQTGLL